MSAAERASEAGSAEQANELAVRANEQMEERMAQSSTRRNHSYSTHCALIPKRTQSEKAGKMSNYEQFDHRVNVEIT